MATKQAQQRDEVSRYGCLQLCSLEEAKIASRLDRGRFSEQLVKEPLRAMLAFSPEWFTGYDVESNG